MANTSKLADISAFESLSETTGISIHNGIFDRIKARIRPRTVAAPQDERIPPQDERIPESSSISNYQELAYRVDHLFDLVGRLSENVRISGGVYPVRGDDSVSTTTKRIQQLAKQLATYADAFVKYLG